MQPQAGATSTTSERHVWDLALPDNLPAFAALAAVGAGAASIGRPPEVRLMPLDPGWLDALVDPPLGRGAQRDSR